MFTQRQMLLKVTVLGKHIYYTKRIEIKSTLQKTTGRKYQLHLSTQMLLHSGRNSPSARSSTLTFICSSRRQSHQQGADKQSTEASHLQSFHMGKELLTFSQAPSFNYPEQTCPSILELSLRKSTGGLMQPAMGLLIQHAARIRWVCLPFDWLIAQFSPRFQEEEDDATS